MSNEIRRGAFEAMSPAAQMTHVKSGGRVVADPAPSGPPPRLLAANQKLRADFCRMKPAEQMEWIKGGGKVVD